MGRTLKWTYEEIENEAKKYTSRSEFSLNCPSAYQAARNRGSLDRVCSHMSRKKRTVKRWSEAEIRKEALRARTRSEFNSNSPSAYRAARELGILEGACGHMKPQRTKTSNVTTRKPRSDRKPHGFWTVDRCDQESKKYKNRTEFQRGSSAAYQAAHRHGWIDEKLVGSHFSRSKRTRKWTPETLKSIAQNYDDLQVFRKEQPNLVAAAKYSGIFDALTKHMKNNKSVWDFDNLKTEALKYNSKTEFQKKSPTAYTYALKHERYGEITEHMKKRLGRSRKREGTNKPRAKWSYENLHAEALKYDNRKEFDLKSHSAYVTAQRKGLLDKICAHMKSGYKYKYTEADIREIAAECETLVEFNRFHQAALKRAKALGIFDEVTSHLKKGTVWGYREVHQEALKYDSPSEFNKGCSSAFCAARRMDIMKDVCSHMTIKERHPNGYWNFDTLFEEAANYNSRSEFAFSHPTAYAAATKLGILDQVCGHMEYETWDRKNGYVYLYVVADHPNLVKFGIAAEGNLLKRISDTARQFKNGLSQGWAFYVEDASGVEELLTDFGETVDHEELAENYIDHPRIRRKNSDGNVFYKIDGHTEMRKIVKKTTINKLLLVMADYAQSKKQNIAWENGKATLKN